MSLDLSKYHDRLLKNSFIRLVPNLTLLINTNHMKEALYYSYNDRNELESKKKMNIFALLLKWTFSDSILV